MMVGLILVLRALVRQKLSGEGRTGREERRAPFQGLWEARQVCYAERLHRDEAAFASGIEELG